MKKRAQITKELKDAIALAEKRGMSRYAIAKAAGIRLPVLVRIANGGTIPRLDTAEKIAGALGKRLTIIPK
ncbi:MAG TPA: helix-turn-helix transcriptional regulator [Tepidisphaeraceae bacterium]|jgi:transcriptional regulator with XRE-family HTH domain